jgi:hypothetical protein
MTDDRKAGIILIAGSVGAILTMAIHPGQPWLPSGRMANLIAFSGAAHSLAIVSIALLFLGACGLSSRIASPDRLSFAAVVAYGLACVAALIAAAINGFAIPSVMRHMAHDVPTAAQQWRILIDGLFQVNQAFARIFSVAASAAIILWSMSVMRNGRLGRGIAIYGCIIATLIIVGIGIGHLRLDVHGMAIVALAQVVWFIIVGSQLCARPPSARQMRGSERTPA